jgi:hypothetical protein
VELERSVAGFKERGLGVAAISYDTPAILKSFAGRAKITYPLLSDPDSKVIRAFGILNETVPAGNAFYGIPYPGTYIVDPAGKVVSKYFEDDYTQRDTASSILVKEFGAAAGASHVSVETKHLTLSSNASASVVRSGQHIVLTLEIELKPKMHVYAPGVQDGYRPIEWPMKESAAVVAAAADFPKAEILFLEAINEKVPVYKGKLRLVREITIAKDAVLKPLLSANGEFTVEGEFKYQACDDRVCYLPTSIPLKWTFVLESHDRQRAPEELRRKAK